MILTAVIIGEKIEFQLGRSVDDQAAEAQVAGSLEGVVGVGIISTDLGTIGGELETNAFVEIVPGHHPEGRTGPAQIETGVEITEVKGGARPTSELPAPLGLNSYRNQQ